MKFYDAKLEKYFALSGTLVKDEPGYRRISQEDREHMKSYNPSASYLATNSSGINIRFKTDSKQIKVKVKLDGLANMNHMSALGQCGLDLYVFDERYNEYVFHNATIYDQKLTEFEYDLGNFETNEIRDFWINLSLYQGTSNLEIGVEDDAILEPIHFEDKNPIVFYGTSITQGGCVSRPGMLHTNLISRWMNKEIYNYGLSGSAFLEKELATIIAKVSNPSLLVVDAQANAGIDDRLEKNLANFIDEYRLNHPLVPIIIVSRIHFALDLYNTDKLNRRNYYIDFIKNYVNEKSITDKNIFYFDGGTVFKKYFTEMTVDGIHPNDAGSMQMAISYFDEINKVLNNK
ncbi:SGNH/GDSL hydrolase family protein [Haploplasma modicum]|uniref:SGNH/GDSL hydrolase family protein n=1 Tax=Haploplasma modicum TaxID=2150 RepID=UPI00047DBBA6|nr:SGNH/GDSL hydrolase family protein [Haploplasma modicum]